MGQAHRKVTYVNPYSNPLMPGSVGPGHANLWMPRPLHELRAGQIPLGCWVLLVDVLGTVHMTFLWAVDADPRRCNCHTEIAFSTSSTVFVKDDEADWTDFIVEAFASEDAARHRAAVIGQAYHLHRSVAGDQFIATAGMRALAEWRKMMPTAPQF